MLDILRPIQFILYLHNVFFFVFLNEKPETTFRVIISFSPQSYYTAEYQVGNKTSNCVRAFAFYCIRFVINVSDTIHTYGRNVPPVLCNRRIIFYNRGV